MGCSHLPEPCRPLCRGELGNEVRALSSGPAEPICSFIRNQGLTQLFQTFHGASGSKKLHCPSSYSHLCSAKLSSPRTPAWKGPRHAPSPFPLSPLAWSPLLVGSRNGFYWQTDRTVVPEITQKTVIKVPGAWALRSVSKACRGTGLATRGITGICRKVRIRQDALALGPVKQAWTMKVGEVGEGPTSCWKAVNLEG